jgi:uncharacterized protein
LSSTEAIRIGGIVIEPGARRVVHLPIAGLYAHTAPIHLPVHVVRGKRSGERLFLSAAIHGDELNGVEIVRRVLAHRTLRQLRGTLFAVPVVNAFGMIQHSRYLPDRRDLNRSFPGSSSGSLAARLAHRFTDEIVRHCRFGIDLHTGAVHRSNLPQIRADLSDPATLALATAFGVPVLIDATLRDGSLRQAATDLGVRMLLYEAGEALRFDELSIRAGVDGVIRVLRALDMLPPARSERIGGVAPFIARSTTWVRAPSSGVLMSERRLGDHVAPGDVLATIADPSNFFDAAPEPLRANARGVVIGHTRLPLVNEGDALFHIASFADALEVASEVANFSQDVFDADAMD